MLICVHLRELRASTIYDDDEFIITYCFALSMFVVVVAQRNFGSTPPDGMVSCRIQINLSACFAYDN